MKEYQIIFKFSDVINTIEAKTKEEAKKIANELLEKGELQSGTYCYEIETEEVLK